MKIPNVIKGRIAALCGGILCFSLLVSILLTPVAFVFRAQMREMETTAHEIAMYRARLALLPAVEAQRSELLQQAASEPGLIQADDATLAAAELQRVLEALIGNHGGEMRSTQVASPEAAEGFETIAVQNAFSLPATQFANLLYALETQDPFLFLDRMEISGPSDWQSEVESGQEPRLQLDWTVHGFRGGGS